MAFVKAFETDSADFHQEVEECLASDQRPEAGMYPCRDPVHHRELAAQSAS
jgi:hypothetical protein